MAQNLTEAKSDLVKMECDEIISNEAERQDSSSTKMEEGKTENKFVLALTFTTINHHKTILTSEDDEKTPAAINIAFPLRSEDPTTQPLTWKRIEQVEFKEAGIIIPKDVASGIYQLKSEEIEKLTSQASGQQLTKRSRTTSNVVLYPLMNTIRPAEDVEVGVGLNANSVTILAQQADDKDFFQCPACLVTKDDIIVRCQTKATINTVKACLKNKHDPVLQLITVKYISRNKKAPTPAVSASVKRQYNFENGMFTSNTTYPCGAMVKKGKIRKCDKKTKGLKFCYVHREMENEKMLYQNIWNDGENTEVLSYNISSKEISVNTEISFSQILCRFVGELDMLATAGSSVKPMKPNSISDPDWGNRIALGSMEEANCCIEFNNQFGFVVRAVKDIEVDETLILYDKTCSAMASDEHIEARKD